MKTSRRQFVASVAMSIVAPRLASAQGKWPVSKVTYIVGAPPGGPADFGARILADELTQMGYSAIVDNRPGSGGLRGAAFVSQAAPDGYTLLVAGAGDTVMVKTVRVAPPYEMKAFQPIARLFDYPFLLLVPSPSSVKTWDDLVRFAKTSKLTYAMPGLGTSTHLIAEQIFSQAGIQAVAVPYPGAAPIKADLIAGRVDFAVDALPGSITPVRDGTLRAIGVTSQARLPELPDVPTTAEIGLPTEVHTGWIGLFALAPTPQPIQQQIFDITLASIKAPSATAKMKSLNYRPATSSADTFNAFVAFAKNEEDRWAAMAKHVGFQPM